MGLSIPDVPPGNAPCQWRTYMVSTTMADKPILIGGFQHCSFSLVFLMLNLFSLIFSLVFSLIFLPFPCTFPTVGWSTCATGWCLPQDSSRSPARWLTTTSTWASNALKTSRAAPSVAAIQRRLWMVVMISTTTSLTWLFFDIANQIYLHVISWLLYNLILLWISILFNQYH